MKMDYVSVDLAKDSLWWMTETERKLRQKILKAKTKSNRIIDIEFFIFFSLWFSFDLNLHSIQNAWHLSQKCKPSYSFVTKVNYVKI